ncbi:unnamed protein product [Urochloa decumbens]|uniref:KIB1-4 beta-propeller domain-containing protein n=1 Tax=Urochloa decumbens TaxID=240449 RepID=A0ABC8ZF14_9POAL
MKSPQLFLETAPSQPDPSELRDWSHLPDLILREVLQRLVPCLRSLSAFAGACRPWRRFLLASASTLLLPRIPPLLLKHERCYFGGSPGSFLLRAWSALVIRQPITSPLAAAAASTSASLLSSSRGLLIFLVRPRGLLVLVDALTGAERLSLPLPSPHAPHHYAALTTTHLVLFVSKHAFASIPFPPAAAAAPDWAHHRLPRAASFVASITEFRGRVLGVTDRAQLLEFRCLAAAAAPAPEEEAAVEMLPATGLPDAATFESWHFGPRLVVAGDRLLLLLLMTDPAHRGSATGRPVKVHRVSVHALHETPDGAMRRWEEVDNLGGYSVFVDCAGRSAVACADAAGCGDVAGNCIYFAEMTFHREYCQRYWMSLSPWWKWEHSAAAENKDAATISRKWPSQTWAYPRLFFQSSTAAQL